MTMEIAAIAPAAQPAPSPRPGAALASDFDTFLRMLTAQIRNQDPLNPMQSTEFATQLATFSGVEQQVRTNDLLTSLAARIGQSGLGQLANWIGMEVQTTAPVAFDGAPVRLALDPPAGADRAELVVRDQHDNEVARSTITPLPATPEWVGMTAEGVPLPAGEYHLHVESWAGEVALPSRPVAHYAQVDEARSNPDGTITLGLAGGGTTPAAAVTALRRGF